MPDHVGKCKRHGTTLRADGICPSCVVGRPATGLFKRLFSRLFGRQKSKTAKRTSQSERGSFGKKPHNSNAYVGRVETAKITVVMICTDGSPLRDDGMVQRILDFNQVKRLVEGRIRVVTLGNVAITEARTPEEKFRQAVASLINQGIEPNPEKMEQYDITDPATGTIYRVTICPPK